MLMSWIWAGIAGISILCAALNGRGGILAAAVLQVRDDPVWLYRAVTVQCDSGVEDGTQA